MCIFTHFAAGALAGGLTGNVYWAAPAGFASHAVLDVIPHYDHPDWRLELAGGIASLFLLLLMPFASGPAVVGGVLGVMPDLENLFQKLGIMGRERFLYPTHTGLLPHGRTLGPKTLVWQVAIFIGCYLMLGLMNPGGALAAEGGPRAVMSKPQVSVVQSDDAHTVFRVDFPVAEPPKAWASTDVQAVQWALPLFKSENGGAVAGESVMAPPRVGVSLAVPTRDAVTWRIVEATWWRRPEQGSSIADLVHFSVPVVFRSVPLTGAEIPVAINGGIFKSLTVEVFHVATGKSRVALAAGPLAVDNGLGMVAAGNAGHEPVPNGVVNPELFRKLAAGSRRVAQVKSATAQVPDLFALTNHWVKLKLSATGIYRLTGQDLANDGLSALNTDPDQIRLYRGGSVALNLNPEYPDSLQLDAIGLHEVAIEVRDGADGEWNLDDEIRFYGVGPSAWRDRLSATGGRLEYYDHPNAAEAVYWLSWEDHVTVSPLPGAPRRVVHEAAAPTAGLVVDTARLRLHREEQFVDVAGLVQDNWVWDNTIFSSRGETFAVRPPVPGSTTRYQVDVRGVYDQFSYFWFDVGAHLNGDPDNATTIRVNYTGQNDSLRVRLIGDSTALVPGENVLTVTNLSSDRPLRPVALDSYDILYWTALRLAPGLGQLAFTHWGDQVSAPGTAVDLTVDAVGLSTIEMWDVTDPAAARVWAGTDDGAGHHTYGVVRSPNSDRHFVATTSADLMAVSFAQRAAPISLRNAPTAVDYVVVHAAPFLAAASDLASFHSEKLAGVAHPVARAINVEDIYDNFSGGQKDPLAVRNYLRWMYTQGAHRLRYACFLGNASRDYRNFRQRTPLVDLYDLMPTQVRTSFPQIATALSVRLAYASDDGLVSFDNVLPGDYDFPDLACGRLPALNLAEARGMVDRVIAYEDQAEPGLWRNQVLMTADDVVRPNSYPDPQNGEFAHTVQAEIISNGMLPLSLDVKKIYGVDYDFPPGSLVKPAARADINAALSAGTTIFYYVGHGAEDNLADEQIFQSRDIPNLTNGGRRPVFMAFSCDVGIFDSPSRRSMAEQFLQYETGGCIGAICASQVSFISWNNALSSAFFGHLYPGLHVDPQRTVATALLLAKADMTLSPSYRTNSQRYNYFGDPGLVLPNPVDDLTFAAGTLDTLRAGARQAAVLTAAGNPAVAAGDSYVIRVEESASHPRFPFTSTLAETSFVKPGSAVFVGHGSVGVAGVTIPFKVASQMHYGELARLRLVVDTSTGGHAAATRLSAVRAGIGASNDFQGPTIDLSFPNHRYRVRAGDQLTAALSDTSGIAILGSSPANSLLLELDNSGFMSDVTGSFVYAPGSYTSGQVVFPLPADLEIGKHLAALHGSDALGNVGSDTLSFEIVPAGVVAIHAVTLFPNPTPGYCRLLFELSDAMEVQWDIYSLAGSRLRSIRADRAPGAQILEWDGRDSENGEIANGTYFYVLRGRGASADGREITETGRFVIMR